ncbi:larval cuticle protein 16/17-like isoform X2 [Zophobas morio]|uniref:larval cuticle protein 16/17-like isoform X2 n=1 Tax=Zophobas morio TaxID=2755281 RepID=UPI00308279CE
MEMRRVVCAVVTLAMVRSSAPAAARLSLVDWNSYNYHEPQGPGTYAFGYDIDDASSNNVQFRNEERHPNGTVTGSYGYVAPDGNVRVVNYIADQNGYRATEENPVRLSMLKPIRYPDTPFFIPSADYSPYTQYPSYQGYPPYRRYFPHK